MIESLGWEGVLGVGIVLGLLAAAASILFNDWGRP